MKCVDICKSNAHYIVNEKHQVYFSKCELRGDCVKVCDSKSLSIIGYQQTVKEIITIAMQDYDYYKNSNGGLTLSGGEPMAQFDFTYALLKAAKDKGISTCLDTSGYASKNKFEKILPLVDVFLFDYKATGDAIHKQLTGVSQNLILKNLDLIYASRARIILRCPMIPSVNDTASHLKAIAKLDKKYPDLEGIELMPYHKMGNEKGIKAGIEPTIDYLEDTNEEIQLGWLEKLHSLGCTKVIIG
jgi:pyruvate formate lyase activating enzyme